MSFFASLTASLQSVTSNPSVFLTQAGFGLIAVILVFLVLFTTRDVILRSHSFLFQFFSILIVAALPVIGFLLYLLIRPSTTLWQRTVKQDIHSLMSRLGDKKHQQQAAKGSSTFKMNTKKIDDK